MGFDYEFSQQVVKLTEVTIAVDAAGGDHGAATVVPAVMQALTKHSQLKAILAGDEAQLEALRAQAPASVQSRCRLQHASQRVEMDEPPAQALRKKKDSSMRVAIDLVAQGRADACISAGNTGALMATARYVLKTLPGIDRPAIISALPTVGGHTHMLDLGANVDCTAEHLYQFAVMGSILAAAVDRLERPRIGLLNIGEEDIKGNDQVKDAGRLLEASDLNYIGYVEADDIYKHKADVVVCDGFVGNVSLKTSEGVARMISHFLGAEFKRNPLNKFIGLLAKPVLHSFKQMVDPRRYNGASLLGLKGIVVKSHGGADTLAFANAIDIALIEVANEVPKKISHHLERQLDQLRAS